MFQKGPYHPDSSEIQAIFSRLDLLQPLDAFVFKVLLQELQNWPLDHREEGDSGKDAASRSPHLVS